MANEWHGYSVWECPDELAAWQWEAIVNLICTGVEEFNLRPNSPQPAERLHTRANPDGTKLIVESVFRPDWLVPARWGLLIRDCLNEVEPPITGYDDDGNPIYPEDPRPYRTGTIQKMLGNRVTAWGRDGPWAESGDAARAYLAENAAEWGEVAP